MKLINDYTRIGEKVFIKDLIPQVVGHGGSFMFWRLPNSNDKNLIVSNSGALMQDELSLEDSKPGFAVAPFNPEEPKLFFSADLVFRFRDDEIIDGPDLNNTRYVINPPGQESGQKQLYYASEKGDIVHADFASVIQAAVRKIESGTVEKIVPSRFKEVDLPENFDVLKTFYRLCEKHPNAFVSLVSSPETGTWLGASPELLVSIDTKDKFRTIALAGTLPFQAGMNLKSVAWTQKEIEEQALVSRYIINCFKKIRVREYAEHGPRTVVAGNLVHLQTDYEVDMKEVNFPQLGSVMLKLLHPTSAVCGMPLEPAQDFLKKNEGYDRDLYSGYLGPVNFDGESKLFVNLRCVQIFENTARIYAGAGVTADSDPSKEVEEVEMKIQTLSQIINS
ncbi:MAG TPA: chorismate-binding protein [Cyclobacteriaceae bacterium]|nr:chorismate-binding protein [Cyclobacteriaceae bacterium]